MNDFRKPILSGQSPLAMFVFSSMGVLLIGLLFQLTGMLFTVLFFDVSVFDLLELQGDEENKVINAIKFLQIFGALGTFVFSSFLISFFYTGSWFGYFHFGREINPRAAVLLVLIMVAALPFVNFLTDINQRFEIPFETAADYLRQLEDKTENMMMTLIRADNIGALLVNIFMIAIIPAVGEELVFRGLIQRHLTEMFKNGHLAVIVASVIFSLVHFQIFSFLPRFFLGLILGYAFYYGKTIWYPMIAHLVNNTLGVVFYYYYTKGQGGETLEEIGTSELMPAMALLSLFIVALLMYLWVKVLATKLPRPGY
ncbi:MAG: CPBP family intramembrane glutamic endopeptidase [Bacteroidales bacterium]